MFFWRSSLLNCIFDSLPVGSRTILAILVLWVSTVFAVPSAAQFLGVPERVQGVEDNSIPLGITVDPVLTDGGKQLDIAATAVGFRDASALGAASFTIPPDIVAIRVTGVGGNDNGLPDTQQEDYHLVSILVDLDESIFSGSVFSVVGQSTRDNDDYSFLVVAYY